MGDFINYLQHRIEQTKTNLQQANEMMQKYQAERSTLEADLQGYERALAAEMRNEGMQPTTIAVQLPLNGDNHDAEATETTTNKAAFARQFIRARADSGATPADLYRGFQTAGIAINRPYVYALIQRLQKQAAIRSRRGKWYPVPVSEQAVNGTGEKALP